MNLEEEKNILEKYPNWTEDFPYRYRSERKVNVNEGSIKGWNRTNTWLKMIYNHLRIQFRIPILYF